MARLNDPPAPPPESIDALKRRFIRQNREIARVNSNQSQRIRNLEVEISRIAAENLTLRQEIITAQAEAERWRQTKTVNREILDLKDRLERKLKDVVALVSEMTDIPEHAPTRRQSRRRSGAENLKTTSEVEWKNRLAIREGLAKERGDSLDGRLPSILEDKLYPRRTLESAEVMALRDEAVMQNSTESPDLGPPPVAHFDVQEPITFDASKSSEQESTDNGSQLPSTLERRRRRRTSALLQDMPKEAEVSEQHCIETSTPQLLKAGAKRKLDASELEEPVSRHPSESDDFIFQRRQDNAISLAGGKKSSRFARPPGRENDLASGNTALSPQKIIAARKILAPKTTNSPAKRKVPVSEKHGALEDTRKDHMDQATVKPSRRTKLPPALEKREIPLISSEEQRVEDLQPKTPAPLSEEILSPVSTEPSVRNTHQNKTEAAVLNSVEDVLNGSIGRGSRRARAAISYAEPSLRDKMRRPGKELVGAVEGLDKNRETTSSHSRGASLDRVRSEGEGEDLAKVPVNVKQESTLAEDRWKELPLTSKKDEPASPLRDKERKGKIREKPSPSSSKNDATRLRDSSKTPSSSMSATTQDHGYADDLENAVERLSIFDPPVSSPLDDPRNSTSREPIKVVTTASGSKRRAPAAVSSALLSRRHSTQASSSSSNLGEEGMMSGRPRGTNVAPRPNSAASLRNDSSSAAVIGGGLKRSASAALSSRNARGSDSRQDSVNLVTDRKPAAAPDAGAERVAMTRRRSMMV